MFGMTHKAETSIDIAAADTVVWEAITTSGGLAHWLGEGASIDPVRGGVIVAPDPVGGRARAGIVDYVDDVRRLGFRWWPVGEPAKLSHVSIELTDIEGGTRVTVVELVEPGGVAEAVNPMASASDPIVRHATGGPTSAIGAASAAGLAIGGAAMVPLTVGPLVVASWSWRLALLTLACHAVRC